MHAVVSVQCDCFVVNDDLFFSLFTVSLTVLVTSHSGAFSVSPSTTKGQCFLPLYSFTLQYFRR